MPRHAVFLLTGILLLVIAACTSATDPTKGSTNSLTTTPSTNTGTNASTNAAVKFTVATPTFSPAAGSYNATQTVSLSTTNEFAFIRYTVDGSTPTAASPLYVGPISVATTTTVKAIAMKEGYSNSAVASAAYTLPYPALSACRICEYRFAYPDQATTVSEIDIDNNGNLFVSGTAWGIAPHFSPWAKNGYDYFITRCTTNYAFSSPAYIWEGNAILITQFTNFASATFLNNGAATATNIARFGGFAIDQAYNFYVPNLRYDSGWRLYQFSNSSGTVTSTRHLYSGLMAHVNDRTTRVMLDESTATPYLYLAGAYGDGVTEDIYVVDNNTWSTPSNALVFTATVEIVGMDLDASRNLYVSDAKSDGIWKVPLTTAPLGYGSETFLAGGTGSAAGRFNGIADIAVSGSSIYAADTGNHRIQKLTTGGAFVMSLDLRGLYGSRFESPRALKVKGSKLYVACAKAILEVPLF